LIFLFFVWLKLIFWIDLGGIDSAFSIGFYCPARAGTHRGRCSSSTKPTSLACVTLIVHECSSVEHHWIVSLHPITFCVPDVSDKLEFAAQKPWRYFLSLFQNLLQCKISIALIKLHKAKTSQSILGVSTSSIASIIIAIPQRIPIIPLINLITFST